MQLDPRDMRPIVNRAKRAQGHLAKVVTMMEDGADCEDVVVQLSAVLKALERTAYQTIVTGLQQCLTEGGGPESVDVKKLEKLFLGLA
jgi:DNA-binding FrmR family transcriptional regulator